MLARALMDIQEPEDAKFYFLKANELNKNDEDIVRDIGKCMVQCHDYTAVISSLDLSKNIIFNCILT